MDGMVYTDGLKPSGRKPMSVRVALYPPGKLAQRESVRPTSGGPEVRSLYFPPWAYGGKVYALVLETSGRNDRVSSNLTMPTMGY